MFEIPNHNPISTPGQVWEYKKSRKTSKRLLQKVYTCIMILLTTQTKEKKMTLTTKETKFIEALNEAQEEYNEAQIMDIWECFSKHETAGLIGSLTEKKVIELEHAMDSADRNDCSESEIARKGWQIINLVD